MKFVKRSPSLFERDIPSGMSDPYISGLDEAVSFVKSFDDITIVGDYDADGVASTAILGWMFRAAGIETKLRLPHRMSEGYGFIPKVSSGLVITIDNGIASVEAIADLKKKGIAVGVIDHHLPRETLPPADFIIDPNAVPGSEYNDYCGAGLAFRFAGKFLTGVNLSQLQSLAALATYADVVPLTGANRTLLQEGLDNIRHRRVLPGFAAILDKIGNHINEEDLGFKIGPVFNAAGRLYDDGAERVLKLLMSKKDNPQLDLMAADLYEVNEERKRLVAGTEKYLHKIYSGERPIVLYDKYLPEGIVGILAGHFCEEYNCPAIVLTETKGVLKGSGRSIPEINLKEVLDKCSPLLLSYGGHKSAAGLSLKEENLEEFKTVFREAVGKVPDIPSVMYYDEELTLKNAEETYLRMSEYGPFGEGNPKPLFRLQLVPRGKMKRIGDGSHFMSREGPLTLVGFGLADKYELLTFGGREVEFVGYLNEDWWNERRSLKFDVQEIA